MIDHDEVIDYIKEEIRPKLKKTQIEKMMDHLYASEYVAANGRHRKLGRGYRHYFEPSRCVSIGQIGRTITH